MSTPILGQFYDNKLPPSRNPTGTPGNPVFNTLGYFEDTIVLDYTFADTTATISIPASAAAPVYLIDVVTLVRTILAGGTATVAVGDGTTVNLYATTGNVTNVAGTVYRSVVGSKLVANSSVVATIGAGNTSGNGTLIVRVFRVASALPII